MRSPGCSSPAHATSPAISRAAIPTQKETLVKYGWESEYLNSRDFRRLPDEERKALAAEFTALGLAQPEK